MFQLGLSNVPRIPRGKEKGIRLSLKKPTVLSGKRERGREKTQQHKVQVQLSVNFTHNDN